MAVDVANNVDAGTPGEGEADNKMVADNNPDTVETATKTDHMFRQCPDRFCQSCGNKGHDGWDRECPKYQ